MNSKLGYDNIEHSFIVRLVLFLYNSIQFLLQFQRYHTAQLLTNQNIYTTSSPMNKLQRSNKKMTASVRQSYIIYSDYYVNDLYIERKKNYLAFYRKAISDNKCCTFIFCGYVVHFDFRLSLCRRFDCAMICCNSMVDMYSQTYCCVDFCPFLILCRNVENTAFAS